VSLTLILFSKRKLAVLSPQLLRNPTVVQVGVLSGGQAPAPAFWQPQDLLLRVSHAMPHYFENLCVRCFLHFGGPTVGKGLLLVKRIDVPAWLKTAHGWRNVCNGTGTVTITRNYSLL
jgi:hypothetical protein